MKTRKRATEDRDAEFREGDWEPAVFPFTETAGPKNEADTLSSSSDPVEFFNLFLSDELLDVLVAETNRYAIQCIDRDALLEEEKRAKAEVYSSSYPYLVVFYSLVQYLSIQYLVSSILY